MVTRTQISTEVPRGRVDEARAYLERIKPDAPIVEVDREGTGIVDVGASIEGDWVSTLNAVIETLDTQGIEFTVYVEPA